MGNLIKYIPRHGQHTVSKRPIRELMLKTPVKQFKDCVRVYNK